MTDRIFRKTGMKCWRQQISTSVHKAYIDSISHIIRTNDIWIGIPVQIWKLKWKRGRKVSKSFISIFRTVDISWPDPNIQFDWNAEEFPFKIWIFSRREKGLYENISNHLLMFSGCFRMFITWWRWWGFGVSILWFMVFVGGEWFPNGNNSSWLLPWL